jgi:peptidoglycan/xylan/chitin deacetylase (PgdA/CDA1 family)
MKISRRKRLIRYRNKPGVIYWHGSPGRGRIALTFDDGPADPHTLKILDILNEHEVKATFFMVGKKVKSLPHIARRVAEEGHTIGNHTYKHHGQFLATPSMANAEIKRTENIIREITSVSTKFFRPPYGRTNRWALRQAEKLGYIVCLWSVNAGDGLGTNWRRIKKKVLSESEDGAIILMHDGGRFSNQRSQKSTVLALSGIISSLKESGYQLVTLAELLKVSGSQSDT